MCPYIHEHIIKSELESQETILFIVSHLCFVGLGGCIRYGTHGPYNVMVIQLLGHSLQDMFRAAATKTFSVRICLKLAEQALDRLETLHKCGILHRDIKPANFVMGRGRMSEVLYLIDFGLSKFYLDSEGHHIP